MANVKLNVAMGQMRVDGGEPEANLRRAEQAIQRAAHDGCAFVVLPECLDLGWTHPSALDMAEPIPGPHSDRLCQAAREAHIHVVAGLTEHEADTVYNSAILISPNGEIMLKHRKINILDIAQNFYAVGRSLAVVETEYGIVGLDICADNFPHSLALGHSLARMGAGMILSPSAWAVPAHHDNDKMPYGDMWERSFAVLARLYDITVIGVSNVGWMTAGVWQGRKCIGCSLAIGPGGKVLARGPYGVDADALVVVPVELVPQAAVGTALGDLLVTRGHTDM